MKKSMVLSVILIFTPAINGFQRLENYLGFGNKPTTPVQPTKAAAASKVDAVDFWRALDASLSKQGAKPSYVNHARSELHRAETMHGLKPGAMTVVPSEGKLDILGFWPAAIAALEKQGYPANYITHAQQELNREKRAHGQNLGAKRAAKAAPKAVKKPATKHEKIATTAAASKTAKTTAAKKAFLQGKKAGEAHERRVLKRKAEGKKPIHHNRKHAQTHHKKNKTS